MAHGQPDPREEIEQLHLFRSRAPPARASDATLLHRLEVANARLRQLTEDRRLRDQLAQTLGGLRAGQVTYTWAAQREVARVGGRIMPGAGPAVQRDVQNLEENLVDLGGVDPATLAAQAVPMLVTYLRHIGGRLASRAASDMDDAVMGKLTELYERVRARVTGQGFAGQALERLEQDPENERRQGALEDALVETVEADPSFATSLSGLLEDIRRTAGPTLTRIDRSGATSIHGDVSLQGTNVAGRDLHVGDQRLGGEEA